MHSDDVPASVTVDASAPAPLITVFDNLTSDEAIVSHFREACMRSLCSAPRYIILDLTRIDYIASAAIGLIAQLQARLGSDDGYLVVVVSPDDEAVRRVMRVTRLANIVKVVSSLEKAYQLTR